MKSVRNEDRAEDLPRSGLSSVFKGKYFRRKTKRLWRPCTPPLKREFQVDTSLLGSQFFLEALGESSQKQAAFCIRVSQEGRLEVRRHESEILLFALSGGSPWLSARYGEDFLEENRGFFHHRKRKMKDLWWVSESVLSIDQPSKNQIVLQGTLSPDRGDHQTSFTWYLHFTVLDLPEAEGMLELSLTLDCSEQGISDQSPNRLLLHIEGSHDEKVFGCGAQLSQLDLKGEVIPCLTQEPGIGRGVQPLTWFMEKAFGAGGSRTQSSSPAPLYLTSTLQAHAVVNEEFTLIDLTRPNVRVVEVWSSRLICRIFGGADHPLGRIRSITAFTGRMPVLPSWVDQGAILGLQGGTERVKEIWARCHQAGVLISALWLQDWVGKRETSVGEQLWWDWQLDERHYPEWEVLLDELKTHDVRVLGYINPFLVDISEREDGAGQDSLFEEAKEKGYLVGDPHFPASPLMVKNTSFSAAMVDLTSPAAFDWLKDVIKKRLIPSGLSGWMADFGEALPMDAVLHQGGAEHVHNQYPVLWARLNREAIEEEGGTEEFLFFTRSGYTSSPRYCQLNWLGDQLTSWHREDGIYSGLVGLLSAGISGISISHSDTGGYICTDPPRSRLRVPLMSFARTQELLMRWVEMNAFTAVLRTHEGNQPDRHHQIYDDPTTLDHFAKMSKVYVALAPVRRTAQLRSAQEGVPLVAHPWLYYPDDHTALTLTDQFMLGSDVMVAPVLRAGQVEQELYLPTGLWVHWWTGEVKEGAQWVTVDAPLGEPPVFYREGSTCGEVVRRLS